MAVAPLVPLVRTEFPGSLSCMYLDDITVAVDPSQVARLVARMAELCQPLGLMLTYKVVSGRSGEAGVSGPAGAPC
jgi:hypothetical protein